MYRSKCYHICGIGADNTKLNCKIQKIFPRIIYFGESVMFSASISWQYRSRHIFKSLVKYFKHLEKVHAKVIGADSVTCVPSDSLVTQNWGIKCDFQLFIFIPLSSMDNLEN